MKTIPKNGQLSRIPANGQNRSFVTPVIQSDFGRLQTNDLNPPKKIETDSRAAKFDEVKELHRQFCQKSLDAIQIVLKAGKILAGLRATARQGEWELELSRIGMNRMTAWRYIMVFERCASRGNGNELLKAGGDLCELYRELGIIRAREGGGHRSPKWQEHGTQMVFRFALLQAQFLAARRHKYRPFAEMEREQLLLHLAEAEEYVAGLRQCLEQHSEEA